MVALLKTEICLAGSQFKAMIKRWEIVGSVKGENTVLPLHAFGACGSEINDLSFVLGA